MQRRTFIVALLVLLVVSIPLGALAGPRVAVPGTYSCASAVFGAGLGTWGVVSLATGPIGSLIGFTILVGATLGAVVWDLHEDCF